MERENQTGTRLLRRITLALMVLALVAIAASFFYGRQSVSPVSTAVARSAAPGGSATDTPDALQDHGFAAFEAGRYDEAVASYRKAVEKAPDKAVLWSALGEAIVMGSRHDPMPPEALAAFKSAVVKDPKDPRGRYFMAVSRDLGGDHQGAIKDWLALLHDTPAGAPWEADLRRTIEQVGKINHIDTAPRLAVVEQGRAGPPPLSAATSAIPGPTPHDMRAAAQLPPGQQEAMVRAMVDGLEAKLKADPKNVDGWIMLMRSRVTQGETAKASGAYAAALKANPGQGSVLHDAATELEISTP